MRRTVALSMVAGVMALIVAAAPLVGQQEPEGKAQPKAKAKDEKAKRGPGRRVPNYYGQLDLTQEQRDKIYAILEEYRAQIEPLEEQIDKLRGERDKAARDVLTPEQQTKLDELVKEARERRGFGKGGLLKRPPFDKAKIKAPAPKDENP